MSDFIHFLRLLVWVYVACFGLSVVAVIGVGVVIYLNMRRFFRAL